MKTYRLWWIPVLFALGMLLAPLAMAQSSDYSKTVLFWDQPAPKPGEEPRDHTDIRRSDSPCASATFQTVIQTAADILTWTDTNIVPGQTYCYVAVNVGTTGRESVPSNSVERLVPFSGAPPAPTNLRVQ